MLEKTVNSLDIDHSIGDVTLTSGSKLDIPKLSMFKIIKIVKWLGVDGIKLYSQYESIIMDDSIDEFEKFTVILSELPEEQLAKLFAIALDLTEKEVLALDHNEMLEILIVYADVLNLGKTKGLIQTLYKKIYQKEMPNFKNLFNRNQVVNQVNSQQSNLLKAGSEE